MDRGLVGEPVAPAAVEPDGDGAVRAEDDARCTSLGYRPVKIESRAGEHTDEGLNASRIAAPFCESAIASMAGVSPSGEPYAAKSKR